MNFEPIGSLPDVVKGVAAVPNRVYEAGKKTYEGYKKVKDFATGISADKQGDVKAMETARQAAQADLEAQGKTPSPRDIEEQAVKTLGEAKREVKQAEWDKQVDATEGGKTAQIITGKKPRTMPASKEGI